MRRSSSSFLLTRVRLCFTVSGMLSLLLCCWLGHCPQSTESFVLVVPSSISSTSSSLIQRQQQRQRSVPTSSSSSSSLLTLQASVEEIRAEAERVRLEAQVLEEQLTRSKIQRLQEKMKTQTNYLRQHPEETKSMQQQLQALQQKLITVVADVDDVNVDGGRTTEPLQQQPTTAINNVSTTILPTSTTTTDNLNPPDVTTTTTTASVTDVVSNSNDIPDDQDNNNDKSQPDVVASSSSSTMTTSTTTSSLNNNNINNNNKSLKRQQQEQNPLSGFDEEDLRVYLPVAKAIEERMMSNNNNNTATMEEMLAEFRAAPELQEHFQKKIKAMILQPMEDMQELEELRSQFLYTRSRVEKENIRRRIQQMEKQLEEDGPFGYSESIYIHIPPMSPEELEQRIQAVSALPRVLQGLYTLRTKAPEGDIRLAIELDHYEAQLQLLEQMVFLTPWTTELRDEATMALQSLPTNVRKHFAQNQGLEECDDTEEILNHIVGQTTATTNGDSNESEKEWSSLQELVASSGISKDETDDLDYIDRSRYAEEFYPSIARMEGRHPSLEDMNEFIQDVIDRRAFMVQSKPERVVGGWYIRGENLLSEDDDGVQLVHRLMERLEATPQLAQKLQFFYIPDPSPLSDEDFEMDIPVPNLLYVTANDPTTFYNNAGLLAKLSLSTIGIATIALFSLATVEMVPGLQEKFDLALTGGDKDLEWLINTVNPVFGSLLGIYASHELGHAIIALRDKFKIGFGTPLASIQTGFFGSITPLQSPPPSLKSLFDFAMAGPLFGFATSFALFVVGLQATAAAQMNVSMDFPGLPTFLLRSSALCSELVEFFLGKGTLFSGVDLPVEAVLPLHPFAIAGYVGLFVNALALLPIGNTDGGRISLAMFGRRGTYLLSTFTSVVLCLVGLFGWDESRIFLTYTLFTLIWQRELETPARNEVEELDLVRGALGILAALFVGLTLVPFF